MAAPLATRQRTKASATASGRARAGECDRGDDAVRHGETSLREAVERAWEGVVAAGQAECLVCGELWHRAEAVNGEAAAAPLGLCRKCGSTIA